jgi:hypothetical protein
MAIAVEGQKIGGDEEESETLAEDDDVAAAATKNVLGKIQGLKE